MIRFKDSQRFRLKVYEIQVALLTPRVLYTGTSKLKQVVKVASLVSVS